MNAIASPESEIISQVQLRSIDLDNDSNFIVSSWLESYEETAEKKMNIPAQIYQNEHRRIIERILRSPKSVFAVAHTEDVNQILGWAVRQSIADLTVAHYVYVKAMFRRIGLGRLLFSAVAERNCFVTHNTKAFGKLKAEFEAFYNPYLLSEI